MVNVIIKVWDVSFKLWEYRNVKLHDLDSDIFELEEKFLGPK